MLEKLKSNWLLFGVGIVVIIIMLILNNDDVELSEVDNHPIISSDNETIVEGAQLEKTVIVDIKGEVNKPGVYEVDKDARVNDVIKLAGGFSEDADEIPINLAQKVYDELIIFVPKKGENILTGDGQAATGKVRINYATQEEIEKLPGIGPSKAAAIIKHREDNGLFQSVEDLLEISGIGEKTLENMQDDIQIP